MKAQNFVSTNLLFLLILLVLAGCSSDSTESPPSTTENIAPVANAGNNQTVDENTAVTLDASASSDSDGSISSYQWSQTAGTAAALSASNVAMPTFTAPTLNASETLTFQVTVTDNDGAINSSTVNIMVNHINIPPTANAGIEQIVDEQTSVTLNASSSSDSDGSISSYQWSQTAGTAVALSASNVAMPTFTAPTLSASETLTFQVTVTDNDGATNTSTVNIVINPINISPIASAGSEQTVDAQSTVTLNANSSSDEDGTIVSFFGSRQPALKSR